MNKKIIVGIVILFLILTNIGSYYLGQRNQQNADLYNGKTASQWYARGYTVAQGLNKAANMLATDSNKIKQLEARPTPTPEIEYQTQYIPQPTQAVQTVQSKIPGVSNAELLCWYYHIGNCPTQ